MIGQRAASTICLRLGIGILASEQTSCQSMRSLPCTVVRPPCSANLLIVEQVFNAYASRICRIISNALGFMRASGSTERAISRTVRASGALGSTNARRSCTCLIFLACALGPFRPVVGFERFSSFVFSAGISIVDGDRKIDEE
jgi:hypothetical protein